MLKDLVKRLLPQDVMARAQRTYAAYVAERQRRRHTLGLGSFDELFPDAEKVVIEAPETVATPDAVHMHFYEEAADLQQPVYERPAVVAAALRNVLYSRRNVLMTDDRTVVAESINSRRSMAWLEEGDLLSLRIEELSGPCTALRSMHNNYYHTLIDNLPRVSYLRHPYFAQFETIHLLTPTPPSRVEAFFLAQLLPDNVQVQVIPRTGLTEPVYRVDPYLFVSFPTRPFSGYLPASYVQWFRAQFCPDRPSRRDKRIYISRETARWRHVLNEDAVQRELEKEGFHTYALEALSMEEQIALFYDAEMVVAPHGAGLSNLLFSEAARVVELSPTPYLMPYFYFLCIALGHRYTYWCADQAGWQDDFTVDLDALKRLVRQAPQD